MSLTNRSWFKFTSMNYEKNNEWNIKRTSTYQIEDFIFYVAELHILMTNFATMVTKNTNFDCLIFIILSNKKQERK